MNKYVIHSCPSLSLAKKRSVLSTTHEEINIPSSLKNKIKNKKYFILTHGCQANIRDSEIYEGILVKIGYKKTEDINKADLVLINTCAVRENAENKVFGELGNIKNLKKKNKNLITVVSGCMVMQETIVDYVKEKFGVDIILGTFDITKLPALLDERLKTNKKIINVTSLPIKIEENLPSVRNSKFKAFVNISYGCDKFCTYCIVPYTRGRERSRNKEDILKECKELVDKNYKEIVLLGQNVDSYGKDLKDGSNFADLLSEVAKLNIPRLSFLTSHPYDFSLKIIDVMNEHPNIQPYLHLPIQSGDNRVLQIMGRKYTLEKYLDLVSKIREKKKDIFLSTDIIVGFPNESDEEFNNTLKAVKKIKYDSSFTFIYSPRKGTPAAKMEDKITYETKVKRFKKLAETLNTIIDKNNKKYINNVYDVLVDSVSKNNPKALTGRLMNNKMINFEGDAKDVGNIIKVKVLSSHIHYLIGEKVK